MKVRFTVILRTFGSDLKDVVDEIAQHPDGIKVQHWGNFHQQNVEFKGNGVKNPRESFEVFLESDEHFAIQDDWKRWNSDGERGRSGKPFLYDKSGQHKNVWNLALFF